MTRSALVPLWPLRSRACRAIIATSTLVVVACATPSTLHIDDPANGSFQRRSMQARPYESGWASLDRYGSMRIALGGPKPYCIVHSEGEDADHAATYESHDCAVRQTERGYCFERAQLRDVVAEAAGRPSRLSLHGCVALERAPPVVDGPVAPPPVRHEICEEVRGHGKPVLGVRSLDDAQPRRVDGRWLLCWQGFYLCDRRSLWYELEDEDGKREVTMRFACSH